jgi:hypothetical protein
MTGTSAGYRHGWVLRNITGAAEALHGVSKVVPGVKTSKDS